MLILTSHMRNLKYSDVKHLAWDFAVSEWQSQTQTQAGPQGHTPFMPYGNPADSNAGKYQLLSCQRPHGRYKD